MAPAVSELLAARGRSFSFEFFPPKTDAGEHQLWQAISELEPLGPTFVSVTFGAGGTTRDRTVRLTGRIAAETSLLPVGHLTCVGSSAAHLREIVGEYRDCGVRNILALRGDPPGGLDEAWTPHPQGLKHADELVELVHGEGGFCVGVAAFPEPHPESQSAEQDAWVLKLKQDAGAEFAITQFFFHADAYSKLVERCAALGVDLPIIPGIMPVTNVAQIERFAALSGADFPAELASRFHAIAGNPDAVRALGVEVATKLGERLLREGAPGLHFYTLNRSTATREIYQNLSPGQVLGVAGRTMAGDGHVSGS